MQGSAILPIYQTTTFSQREEDITYESVRYTRCCNNPNQEVRTTSAQARHTRGVTLPALRAGGRRQHSSAAWS